MIDPMGMQVPFSGAVPGASASPSVPQLPQPQQNMPTLARQGAQNPFLNRLQRGFGLIGPQPKPGQMYQGPTTTEGKVGNVMSRVGSFLRGSARGSSNNPDSSFSNPAVGFNRGFGNIQ